MGELQQQHRGHSAIKSRRKKCKSTSKAKKKVSRGTPINCLCEGRRSSGRHKKGGGSSSGVKSCSKKLSTKRGQWSQEGGIIALRRKINPSGGKKRIATCQGKRTKEICVIEGRETRYVYNIEGESYTSWRQEPLASKGGR